MVLSFGCAKDPGPGGNAHIHGHVEIEATDTEVADAVVQIWYDATSESGTADDATTTDGGGKFEFENLYKGDYYVSSLGLDSLGVVLTGGTVVTIDKKSGEFDADIHLE